MYTVDTPLLARVGYVSVFTAARVTGYSPRMLRHLIQIGELPAIRKGRRHWKIKIIDLYRCLSQRNEQAKVRKTRVIAALSAAARGSLTPKLVSTIYSTGSKAILKKENTYAQHEKTTEVRP
jgi:hypothetical protein